jgi:hypothetical protein
MADPLEGFHFIGWMRVAVRLLMDAVRHVTKVSDELS